MLILAAIAFIFMPLVSRGQSLDEIISSPVSQPTPDGNADDNVLALLKAMFFQILNTPASLILILGLTIVTTAVDWMIQATDKLSNRLIMPVIFCICVFIGGGTYWLFASPASVEKHFPHPNAVLAVNGLICGFVAFVIHITVVRWILSKIKINPDPPSP